MAEQTLAGRVALVTGAAKRIGRSIALELASRGADVVVNFRGSRPEAEDVAKEIERLGRHAIAIQADVSKRPEVEHMIAQTEATFGRLDILVNNAGMFQHVPFDQITDAQWNGIIATNLTSQFLCAQTAAPLLRKSGRGRIINLASLGGLLAWPGYVHYCVSKAGVVQLTRCLARALAPEITVNAIAPGTITFEGDAPEIAADFITRAPLKRTGKGSDIAEAVAFLVESDFITGQILAVDGGRVLT
ncbi:MAG TPA: 3-oxoacyl-ACP reductase family protein [Candidatus Acidoferrum sp.]|nr:3-oxoacyl-ACP reductase family protein [Candidatus Acidoferrum sp.]